MNVSLGSNSYLVSINPEGFKLPYEVPEDSPEYEYYRQKYFALTNKPSRPNLVRCIGMVHGGFKPDISIEI